MSKSFAIGFGGAVILLGLGVAYLFYSLRGNYLEPTGRILQVRTTALDETSSALILDFEATNPSGRDMIVRTISVSIHRADGTAPDNMAIASSDLPAIFRAHHELGTLDHTPARERDLIKPGQTVTRSVAVRYDFPESDLKQRKDVELVVEDVTGPKLDLTAK